MLEIINGAYVEMTDEEDIKADENAGNVSADGADKLETLAEGLSTAKTLAEVRTAAKSIIESGD